MIIRNCMKTTVFSIQQTDTIREAVGVLVSRHIGLLPVLDEDHRLVGALGLRDLLNLALPSAFHLLSDVDFIGDFGALEKFRPDEQLLNQSVTTIMRSTPVITEDSGLIRAYAMMLQHDLHDLPVVDDQGRLSGIASRVDIGTLILSGWL